MYTVEYYLVVKNDIMKFESKWMELEKNYPKVNKTQKGKCGMY